MKPSGPKNLLAMDQKCLEQDVVQVKQGIQKENEVMESSSKPSVKGFEESDIEQEKKEDLLQLVQQTKRENKYLELSNKYPVPDFVQHRKKIKKENEAMEPAIEHSVKGKEVKVEREIKQETEEDLVQLIQQLKKENESMESPSKHSVMAKEFKAEREIKQEKEEDLDTLIQQMKKENEAMESTSKYSIMGKEVKAEREIKQEREEDLVTLIQQMKKENEAMELISKHSEKTHSQEPMEIVKPITTPTKFNHTQPPAMEPKIMRHQLQVSRKRPKLPIPIESSITSVVPLSVPAAILEKTPNAHLPTKKILLSVTLKPLNAQKVPLPEPPPAQASTPPKTLAITWRKPRIIRAITTQQFMPIANGQSTIGETPTPEEITSTSVSDGAVTVFQKDVLPPQTAITLSASNQTSEKIQQPNTSTIAPETTNPENLRVTRSKSVQKVTIPSEKQTRFAKRAPLKSCSEAIKCIKLMEEYATTKENFQLLGYLEKLEKLINK